MDCHFKLKVYLDCPIQTRLMENHRTLKGKLKMIIKNVQYVYLQIVTQL